MNKKDFTRYVNEQIRPLAVEKQIKVLENMLGWVAELLRAKQKKAGVWVDPSDRDKYVYCKGCDTYYLKDKHKSTYEKETLVVTTYSDGGYGDDDLLGEVEESVEYKTCPKCGYKTEVGRRRLKIIREWPRK